MTERDLGQGQESVPEWPVLTLPDCMTQSQWPQETLGRPRCDDPPVEYETGR